MHIVVIIPCHNEESGIGKVIDYMPHGKMKKLGHTLEIWVVDNNSIDKTAEVARGKGAKVISEMKKGKGHALLTAFKQLDDKVDAVVIIDGDNTYRPQEMPRLIELIENDFSDVVVGSRLEGKILSGSLASSNRIVNWFYTFMVRHIYKANVTDVLSGFIAIRKSFLDKLVPHLQSHGFTIEMELVTKVARMGHSIHSVPITYDIRRGETKINKLRDGLKIIFEFFRNLNWRP